MTYSEEHLSKRGELGGIAGRGAVKVRGNSDYYKRLALKSAKARQDKMERKSSDKN
jgi:hypothetical protein